MPIYIIHGDDIVSSRKFLREQKQKLHSPSVFDGDVDLQDLIQITQGGGLFGNEKKVFIENFFSKNKLNTSKTKGIIDYINKNQSSSDVFFWEEKELQKKYLNLFNNPTVKIFMIPKTIFLFLESIRPVNYKNSINLFHKALQNTEAELIFFMLQRQFRMLAAVSDKKTRETIDEVIRLAPWQRGKLEKQARLFSIDKLLEIYRRLYEIELAQKSGGLPYSLANAIDFFLLSI